MKTTTLTILILLTFTFRFSQTGYDDFTVDSPKNEFQLNIFNLLIFSALDVNYERIVDDESSFGVSMMFSLKWVPIDLKIIMIPITSRALPLVLITEFILVANPMLVFLLKPLQCIQKGITIIIFIQTMKVVMIA